MFQFPRVLIDETKQDVIGANALTHMANTWMFLFHPGVDHGFQRCHIIIALCTIKAFKPVHLTSPIFSVGHVLYSENMIFRNDWRLLYHFRARFTILAVFFPPKSVTVSVYMYEEL